MQTAEALAFTNYPEKTNTIYYVMFSCFIGLVLGTMFKLKVAGQKVCLNVWPEFFIFPHNLCLAAEKAGRP